MINVMCAVDSDFHRIPFTFFRKKTKCHRKVVFHNNLLLHIAVDTLNAFGRNILFARGKIFFRRIKSNGNL